jgi:two-component system, response regulator YesN
MAAAGKWGEDMYRMLVVDDNNRDRRIVREMIDWSELGIEVIGSAANGKEALVMAENLLPHIIISDIAMPEMSGIEMSKVLKEKRPGIKIIFMSCYDDFEFAQSAIDLNVYGYVLKPLILEDIKSAVCKVLSIYEMENLENEEKRKMSKQIADSLPMMREEFFRELLYGTYMDMDDILKRMEFLRIGLLEYDTAQIISMEINDYDIQVAGKDVSYKYLISYSIKSMMNTYTSDSIKVFAVQNSHREFSAVVFLKTNSQNQNDDNLVLECAISFHTWIQDKFGLSTVAGISNTSVNLLDIPRLFQQSTQAIQTKFYSKGNPVILYREVEEKKYSTFDEKVNLEVLNKEVREAVSLKDDSGINEFMQKYLPVDKSYQTEAYFKSLAFSTVNILMLTLIEAGQSFRDIFNDDAVIWRKLNRFDTIQDLQQWLFNMLKTVAVYLRDNNKSRDAKMVNTIKEVIKLRYHEQLSVDDIVKSVYLSPRQANKIFKKEMGNTIFDYLLEYRIEVAKKLLKEPDCKIYMISDNVGYTNKSHFCLMFKKLTGLTPVEYKNRFIP